jgi:Putative adhesin
LGNVTVRAWDRLDAIHIIAEKQSTSPEALARLRVHFTAWAGGEISVETRVEMGGRERALPLVASRVDLVIEVPADLAIEAKTFAGDLSASGLRSGARLETTGGRIGVSDVHGRVVTHQLRGGQTVAAVEGDVDLDGVEGHMQLDRLVGAHVEARVVDGDIHAEDIRSAEVRLSATTGAVVLVGLLRPNAHYDLRSYSGEVRLDILGAPTVFELRARSPVPIVSAIPLRTLWQKGDRLRAVAMAFGARPAAADAPERPVVELSSVLGRVLLTSAQGGDRVHADGAAR